MILKSFCGNQVFLLAIVIFLTITSKINLTVYAQKLEILEDRTFIVSGQKILDNYIHTSNYSQYQCKDLVKNKTV